MKESIIIGKKEITDQSLFFIAEIGANFQGDINMAKKMIVEAKKAGADAVKFQSWKKDTLMVEDLWLNKKSDIKEFGFEKMEDLLDFLSLSEDEIIELKKFSDEVGILFSSTPVTFEDVDLLDELDVAFYKVASCDLDNLPLIEHIAKKGKPIIVSTGMGTLKEIALAVDTAVSAGNNKIMLLHCVSLYPPDDEIVNLNNIPFLKEVFKIPVGFSDHTIGISIPLASIALGANLIEKHFTLNKNFPGWDHKISATPDEFAFLVKEGKRIKKSIGERVRKLSDKEYHQRTLFRRSIVASNEIKKGEIITMNNIAFKRPAKGLSPSRINLILGKRARRNIAKDENILERDVE